VIVTVTPNTTLDLTLFVSSLTQGKTLRATRTVQSMGGKPTDASWILGKLGIPSHALGFAAGLTGAKVTEMLQARGVQVEFVAVDGDSRMNVVVIAQDTALSTTITSSSLNVNAQHVTQLTQQFAQAIQTASCVILGGTLPTGVSPSLYHDLIKTARNADIPTIFDAAQPNLEAGLAAQPTYIKPNRDELEALIGHALSTLDEVIDAGRALFARYGTFPIITLGHEGSVAVLRDRVVRIPPIPLNVVSAAGAGDAMLAGLAASIERDQPIENGLRLGTALSSAVCLQPGTAEFDIRDLERFFPQVQLIPL
jgi:1-phosphofructokinase family hexose kinase